MATLRLSPAITRPNFTTTSATTKTATTRAQISSSLRLPKLTISRRVRRRRRIPGASGAVMVDPAASSYANALADLAKSNGSLEATMADLEKVDKVFGEPAAQSFFSNPTISVEKKALVISEIAESCEFRTHTANFLNILVDMRRMDIVKEIVKEFEISYNKITGTEVGVVSSVVKLESQHLAQIAKAVQRLTGAKNVRIKTVIDPSLVAGFTIRYGSSGSKLIDMSVKKQLNEIAAQLDFSKITLA
ncbi:putative ATP synthase delta chain, chloroplastic [Iris pallida]|uniref:ATP synthase delta chain, chloroplastic n=1 Tax=Iris pallida TaxID=29817 RepID=A0AAX6HNE2_IRIPA|nr:putative ATP synthase delta chain, chloroplastic [Iris pallida]